MHALISTASRPKKIWTESSGTKTGCIGRSTGLCRGSWSPRKDERPSNPVPAKMKNEANKSCIINRVQLIQKRHRDCDQNQSQHAQGGPGFDRLEQVIQSKGD